MDRARAVTSDGHDHTINDHRTATRRTRRTVALVVIIALVVIAVVGTAIAYWVASMQLTALESAVESRGLGSREYLSIGDDGHTVTRVQLVATLHGIGPAC